MATANVLAKRPQAVSEFHKWYYGHQEQTWQNTHWLGVPMQKMPLDLHVYQEIIFETKPDVIIECGTFKGGSALYFASIFDLMGSGRVVTIDIELKRGRPIHPRINYLFGSSTSDDIVAEVKTQAQIYTGERVMVVLDSDHRATHVAAELALYAPLVTPGNYLVVEDTNINGRPVYPDFGPGPGEAVDAFMETRPPFVRDRKREKFGFTFFPGGWLKRVG